MDAEIRRAYAVLELAPPVSADGLKRQYRKLARRWHPDRHASDPAAQAEASDRMRRINDAFRLVASSLESEQPAPEAPPPPRWSAPRRGTVRMSREEIEEMVASINRANTWTLWPQVSRDRGYGLAALALNHLGALAIVPTDPIEGTGGALAFALTMGAAWIALSLIWIAESERCPYEARPVFRRLGWILMAVPAGVGLPLWMLG